MESKINYELSDSKLILYVQEKNDDAKEQLYKKYVPLLKKELKRYKKRALALGIEEADLTQEAMLAFSYAINNFKDDEAVKFITFATLCIRRRLANFTAKFDTDKNKTLSVSLPLDAIYDDGNVKLLDRLEDQTSPDPLKQVINSEELNEVLDLIQNYLSKNERVALEYDIEGKSISEIADLMGMNQKQIYNLIHRARKKIKF